jgi:hypothetical protein
MSCMICLIPYNENVYVIGCGSIRSDGAPIEHTICNDCEITMRMTSAFSNVNGKKIRVLKCPQCRTLETSQGERSKESLKAELDSAYTPRRVLPFASYLAAPEGARLLEFLPLEVATYSTPIIRAAEERLRNHKVWCENGIPCGTKTKRQCKWPMGCTKKVCRRCGMCVSHFSSVD